MGVLFFLIPAGYSAFFSNRGILPFLRALIVVVIQLRGPFKKCDAPDNPQVRQSNQEYFVNIK